MEAQIAQDTILRHKTRHYSLKWENGKLNGIEAWGKQVTEDLWLELDKDTKRYVSEIDLSWQGQERKSLEAFIEHYSRNFVGRENQLRQLTRIALSIEKTSEWGICVQGISGSGKSSLFAKLNRELESEDSAGLILCHAAGITPRSSNLDAMIRRWTQELARFLKLDRDDPSKGIETFDEKKKLFADLLAMAASKTRVICIIDALNQFERSIIARHMTWLPEFWPKNARLITTAIQGEETIALSKRSGIKAIVLPEMDEREIHDMIGTLCERYHKTLHPEIVDAFTHIKHPDKRLAAGNPLWLSIAMEHLLLIDEDDFSDSEKLSGTPEENLHAFLLQVVERFSPNIEDLYDSLLNKANKRFGKRQGIDWIPDLTNFIAASRNGLRSSDVRILLNRQTDKKFELQFAAVRRYLRAHIVQRGDQGLWCFTHLQMRDAVLRRLDQNEKSLIRFHSLLADHFESLPANDPLRQSETMVHIIGAHDKVRGARYYGGDIGNGELTGASMALVQSILEQSVEFTSSLLEQPLDEPSSFKLFYRVLHSLNDFLKNTVSMNDQMVLLGKVEKEMCDLNITNDSKIDWKLLYTECKIAKGDLSFQLADINAARLQYQAALSLLEKLFSSKPSSPWYNHLLGMCYQRIGDALFEQQHFPGAKAAYESTLSVTESSQKQFPDQQVCTRDISMLYERMGAIYENQGDLEKAKIATEKSLEISKIILDQDHANRRYISDLATKYNRLGDIDRKLKLFPDAKHAYRKSYSIYRSLVLENPTDSEAKRNLAASYQGTAWAFESDSNLEKAQFELEAGIEVASELYANDSANGQHLDLLGTLFEHLGDIYLKQKNYTKALTGFIHSLGAKAMMLERGAKPLGRRVRLAIILSKISIVYKHTGHVNKDVVEDLVNIAFQQPDSVNGIDQLTILVWLHIGIGELLFEHGQILPARASYSMACLKAAAFHLDENKSNQTDEVYKKSKNLLMMAMNYLRKVGGKVEARANEKGEGTKMVIRFKKNHKARFPLI